MNIDPIFLAITTREILALTAYAEARSEGSAGMQAVLEVVRNRAANQEKFADKSVLSSTGDIYKAVILKPYQFSPYNRSDQQYGKIKNIAYDFSNFLKKDNELNIAYILAGKINHLKSVGNATYFHSIYIIPPSWASVIPYVATIGNHIFYGEDTVQAVQVVAKKSSLSIIIITAIIWILIKKNK